ncbi:hypothetical protein PYW07_003420 [Mythimna separata]|uniref:Uncharacterized protein n=1 Tax=Mythimna separata TaxID=271217 RepID=A0AAD7YHW3_MYTSE|nr:hypothetical protein PYW07_003420 [Mythimna separata]
MDELKYCRVCLVTDVKMFSLETTSSDSIGVVYSHLAQIPIFDSNQHVCFECASLLYKYQEFKSKCLRAHNIISRIKLGSSQITKQLLKNVDRKINKLESTLILSPVAVQYEEPANNTETEIHNTEDKENKLLEINVKIEEINKTETEKKYDYDDIFDDYAESTEESLPEKVSQPKHKSKPKKEPKAKKRKFKTVIKSEDDLSDDEPLSKSATKSVNTKKIKKKNGLNICDFDDYATVVFLTPEEARKEVLLRKESSNYKKSPFKCDLCFRGFEAKSAFANHVKKHSIENGDYECDLCHLRFPQQVHLCKHRLSCHKRKFSCKLCSYVCYCTYQAKTHVSLHKGKKYPCKHCGEIFSMPNSLLMHKRMKHLKESVRESVCELCGSTFGTPRGLFLHNMKVHRQDKNDKLGPECVDCGAHFTSELAWKRHLVLSTKHKVSNGCKFCGETFMNEDDLKTHLRVHSRKPINRCNNIKLPAACAICDKWLQNRSEYKTHVTLEHPLSDEANKLSADEHTPFVCEVCGQMFKQQCFLTYHQRKHTGERPYKCGECDKTFQLAGALSIHRSVHSRKRPHKCQMCARVFTFKSALNKHMKVHLGIRPHKCAICDKGFIHMCDLKLHIKYVHDKIPWPKKKNKRPIDDAPYLDYH